MLSLGLSVRMCVFVFSSLQFSSKRMRIFQIGLLQFNQDPSKMITIEYGENRLYPEESKRTLLVKLWEFHYFLFVTYQGPFKHA